MLACFPLRRRAATFSTLFGGGHVRLRPACTSRRTRPGWASTASRAMRAGASPARCYTSRPPESWLGADASSEIDERFRAVIRDRWPAVVELGAVEVQERLRGAPHLEPPCVNTATTPPAASRAASCASSLWSPASGASASRAGWRGCLLGGCRAAVSWAGKPLPLALPQPWCMRSLRGPRRRMALGRSAGA